MKITKKVVKEVEIIQDILCNRCGDSLLIQISDCGLFDDEPEYEIIGLADIIYTGSYWSTNPIKDMMTYKFNICEKCLGILFQDFKIPSEQWDLDSQQSIYQIQEDLNQIYNEKNPNKLAEKMLDENSTIRKYSELRFQQLTTKKKKK